MASHKGRLLTGWRELAYEIGIIVAGVLIALIAQQVVEEWSWRQKVASARAAMDLEIKNSLLAAYESNKLQRCQARQLDVVQASIVAGDWPRAAAGLSQGSILSFRFWGEEAFAAMISGQTSDHLATATMSDYSSVYTMIRKNRQHQEEIWATQPILAMMAIPSLPTTPDVRLKELEAITRVSDGLSQIVSQGGALSDLAKTQLGLSVGEADYRKAPGRTEMLAKCEAAAALGKPAR